MMPLVVIGVVILYSVSVGFFQPYFSRQLALRCPNCSKGVPYQLNSNRFYEPGEGHRGIFLAFIWPLVLPYMVANYRADPALRLSSERIKTYWEDKRIAERAQRIAQLEVENDKELARLGVQLDV